MSDDLIRRLQAWGVESAVIEYARDAIASGETRETTIRRLRALGLCPPGFFDEDAWQDIDPERHATPQPPSQGMSPVAKGFLQRRLALFIALAVVLVICKISGEWVLLLFAAPLVVAFLLMVAVGLWITLKGTVTAWWRGGWWSNVAMSACIVAVIGCVWPQTGIWDNAAGRWFFGPLLNHNATAAPAIPPAAIQYLKQHPELAAQFDAKYGAGSAAREMGARQAPAIGTMSQGFEFEGGDPAQWLSWRPVTPKAKSTMLAKAREAIAKGAPRDSVIERMRKFGLDPSDL